jgi:putrescine transport system ATP-binding protein
MDAGRFQQIGTPTEIYEFPESRFVADFIGSANFFEGRVAENGADHVTVKTDVCEIFIDHGQSVQDGTRVWAALRPEKMRIAKTDAAATGTNQVNGVVEDIGYLGDTSIYKVELPNGQIVDVTAPNQSRPLDQAQQITWEDKVQISWEPSSVMLLTS